MQRYKIFHVFPKTATKKGGKNIDAATLAMAAPMSVSETHTAEVGYFVILKPNFKISFNVSIDVLRS